MESLISTPVKQKEETNVPVKPILKSAEANPVTETEQRKENKRKRIIWDEQNLVENESQKSSTMKITEPKTPYNKEYVFVEDEEGQLHLHSPVGSPNKEFNIKWAELHNSLQKAAEEEKKFEEMDHQNEESSEKSVSESEESANYSSNSEGESEFKSKRKYHYNEYLMLKHWKQKQETQEEEEGD